MGTMSALSVLPSALITKLQGDNKAYQKLLAEIHHGNDQFFVDLLNELITHISLIDDRVHQELLQQIVTRNPWESGDTVLEPLMEFMVNLVSVRFKCTDMCLFSLVRAFVAPCLFMRVPVTEGRVLTVQQTAELAEKARQVEEARSAQLPRKDRVLEHLRSTIEQIAELVPTTTMRLQHFVLQNMPHRRFSSELICFYVESVLHLLKGSLRPGLKQYLLHGIVDYLLQMDVELDASLLKDALPLSDAESAAAETTTEVKEDEAVVKMDSLMALCLDFIQRLPEGEIFELVFSALMRSFAVTVLDTERCKFTQFLIFHASSKDGAKYGGSLSASLTALVCNSTQLTQRRVVSIAYLASFLAEASFLPRAYLCTAIDRLLSWTQDFLRGRTGDTPADVESRGELKLFAAVFEAVLYVLGTHLADLKAHFPSRVAQWEQPLIQTFGHSLQPLNMVDPVIVFSFLKKAEVVDFMATAARPSVPNGVSAAASATIGMGHLPFDSYLLRCSARYVRGLMRGKSSEDEAGKGEGEVPEYTLSSAEKGQSQSQLFDDASALAHPFQTSFEGMEEVRGLGQSFDFGGASRQGEPGGGFLGKASAKGITGSAKEITDFVSSVDEEEGGGWGEEVDSASRAAAGGENSCRVKEEVKMVSVESLDDRGNGVEGLAGCIVKEGVVVDGVREEEGVEGEAGGGGEMEVYDVGLGEGGGVGAESAGGVGGGGTMDVRSDEDGSSDEREEDEGERQKGRAGEDVKAISGSHWSVSLQSARWNGLDGLLKGGTSEGGDGVLEKEEVVVVVVPSLDGGRAGKSMGNGGDLGVGRDDANGDVEGGVSGFSGVDKEVQLDGVKKPVDGVGQACGGGEGREDEDGVNGMGSERVGSGGKRKRSRARDSEGQGAEDVGVARGEVDGVSSGGKGRERGCDEVVADDGVSGRPRKRRALVSPDKGLDLGTHVKEVKGGLVGAVGAGKEGAGLGLEQIMGGMENLPPGLESGPTSPVVDEGDDWMLEMGYGGSGLQRDAPRLLPASLR